MSSFDSSASASEFSLISIISSSLLGLCFGVGLFPLSFALAFAAAALLAF